MTTQLFKKMISRIPRNTDQTSSPQPLSKEVLGHYYRDCKKSAYYIAHICSCSTDTVYRHLKKYQIPIRSRKVHIDPQYLKTLYITDDLSVEDIAKKLHASKTTIYERLHTYNITQKAPKKIANPLPTHYIIHAYESGISLRELGKTYHTSPHQIRKILQRYYVPIRKNSFSIDLDMPTLITLYVNKELSTTQIAQLFHVNPSTISNRLREAGIHLRGNCRHFPKEDIVESYKQGLSVTNLAKKYATSYCVIRNILIAEGVYRAAPRYAQFHHKIFHMYYMEKQPIQSIAAYFSCHPETIRRVLRRKKKSNLAVK